MKNDYLIERKDNLFTKVANFIRGLFSKNKGIEEASNLDAVTSGANNNSEFMDYIKLDNKEDEKLLGLQEKFENKEVVMNDLSDSEIVSLKDLYNSQIEKLNKEIDEKKTKIGMLRFRLTGSVDKI